MVHNASTIHNASTVHTKSLSHKKYITVQIAIFYFCMEIFLTILKATDEFQNTTD